MATITGVAGTTINAQCTVTNAGGFITQSESSVTAQSIENDLATTAKRLGCGYTVSVQQPWVVDPDSGGANESHFGVATVDKGKRAKVALDLPHGAVLTQIRVYVFPASPHGALPGTMPTLSLVKWSVTGGSGTVITTGTDGSGSVVAYEALHELVFSLSPTVTVDRSAYVYYLEFNQEDDPNALDGGAVLQPRIHINA
jgi:hypothetical protein